MPGAITAGPDGNLWFTDCDKIGRIAPSGTFKEFRIPGSNPTVGTLVSGPAGKLWFIDVEVNKVGRITTAGVFETSFPAQTQDTNFWLLLGPDGNLWYASGWSETSGSIFRMTPTGVVTKFALPSPGFNVREMAVGPDRNIWFTEQTRKTGKIGRVNLVR